MSLLHSIITYWSFFNLSLHLKGPDKNSLFHIESKICNRSKRQIVGVTCELFYFRRGMVCCENQVSMKYSFQQPLFYFIKSSLILEEFLFWINFIKIFYLKLFHLGK